MAELVDALDSKSSSFGSVGSIPTLSTDRDKSNFFGLSLFLFSFKPLLTLAILSSMGLISAVRTFLFSNWKFSGNIEPTSSLLCSISLSRYCLSKFSMDFSPSLYSLKTSCFLASCDSLSFSSSIRFWKRFLALLYSSLLKSPSMNRSWIFSNLVIFFKFDTQPI